MAATYLVSIIRDFVLELKFVIKTNLIPYTWNFSRYVNFTDFAVSRAAVKIYSVKILPCRAFII